MKRQNPWNAQLVFGIIVIVVGVMFVLDNFDIVYAWDYLRYWPALLVVFGLAKLTERHSSKFWAWTFIVGGGLLLLDRLDMIDFRLGDWWPLILIGIGGTILYGSIMRRNVRTAVLSGDSTESDESLLTLTAVMGGFEKKITSADFKGGNITTIMGGAELDLRNAVIKGDEAILDVFVLMGGIELMVPENWLVTIQGVPVMGGFSDETRPPAAGKHKKLTIQGTVVMGGVEIKN